MYGNHRFFSQAQTSQNVHHFYNSRRINFYPPLPKTFMSAIHFFGTRSYVYEHRKGKISVRAVGSPHASRRSIVAINCLRNRLTINLNRPNRFSIAGEFQLPVPGRHGSANASKLEEVLFKSMR